MSLIWCSPDVISSDNEDEPVIVEAKSPKRKPKHGKSTISKDEENIES